MLLLLIAVGAGLGAAPQSTNDNLWARASEYGRTEGPIITPDVRVELTVDEIGQPVHCNLLKSSEPKGFDSRFCVVPMRRAHFRPARDEAGRPITGVFSTNFLYKNDQHGHGPVWTDYTLTVGALPAARQLVTVARVVTDAGGRVETCAVETSSGDARLDEAACRYTRASLSLAAPYDRDGRAVRAMRLVSIGFTTEGGAS